MENQWVISENLSCPWSENKGIPKVTCISQVLEQKGMIKQTCARGETVDSHGLYDSSLFLVNVYCLAHGFLNKSHQPSASIFQEGLKIVFP